MKLQTDTFYKTRDGRKAYVNCSKPCKAGVSYNGVIVDDEEFYDWFANGRYSDEEKTRVDLVSEWKEESFHLEIGKRYKTRGGRIAFVQGANRDYFTGVIVGASTFGNTWSADGRVNDNTECNYDLVECIDD